MLGVCLLVFVVEVRSGGSGCVERLEWIAAVERQGHGSGGELGFGGGSKRQSRGLHELGGLCKISCRSEQSSSQEFSVTRESEGVY